MGGLFLAITISPSFYGIGSLNFFGLSFNIFLIDQYVVQGEVLLLQIGISLFIVNCIMISIYVVSTRMAKSLIYS